MWGVGESDYDVYMKPLNRYGFNMKHEWYATEGDSVSAEIRKLQLWATKTLLMAGGGVAFRKRVTVEMSAETSVSDLTEPPDTSSWVRRDSVFGRNPAQLLVNDVPWPKYANPHVLTWAYGTPSPNRRQSIKAELAVIGGRYYGLSALELDAAAPSSSSTGVTGVTGASGVKSTSKF